MINKIMRIFWIAPNSGLMPTTDTKSYNGGGWIAGLQAALQLYGKDYSLGIAFSTHKREPFKLEKDQCVYYPIYSRKSLVHKVMNRLRWKDSCGNFALFKQALNDFKPDIVHVFGVELPYSSIISEMNVPIVVHLQGFLNPYLNAYFPPGLSLGSLMRHSNWIKELLGIGFTFKYKAFRMSTHTERNVLFSCKFVMGRTQWDRQITDLLACNAQYYHVEEVLRPPFYAAPKWRYRYDGQTVKLITTISSSIYKGLDLILKAALLMEELKISYSWNIIGIDKRNELVRLFEKQYRIKQKTLPLSFCGRKNEDEIINLILQSDLYVHPSYIENSPNSVCEAQLLGIPVVACNVGGVSSLIENGKTGFLIPANAPYELSYIIKHYNEYPMKEIAQNEIQSAGKRHDRRNIVNALFTCYEECIKQ